ncbi:MAG: hypothetical protein ACE5EA_11470 [Nitrospirota bacterium]
MEVFIGRSEGLMHTNILSTGRGAGVGFGYGEFEKIDNLQLRIDVILFKFDYL